MLNKKLNLKQHPTLTTTQDLLAICEPLYALNIKIMNFIRVTHDRKVIYLCDHHDWIKHYLQKGYPQIGAFEHNKILIPDDYILWSSLENDDPIVIDSREIFNIHHGITLTRTHALGQDFFNFGVFEPESAIKDKLQTQVEDLQHFIDIFYEKTHILLPRAQKNFFHLDDFSVAQGCNESSKKSLYLGPEYQNQYLTPKEIACIRELVQGSTIPNIAMLMNLSHRTVEKHLENIKRKLNCHTQCQLGYVIAQLGLLDNNSKT